MPDEPPQPRPTRMSREVEIREKRMLKAKRTRMRSVWQGFGFFGLIGWSIVVPMLIGAAMGHWLQNKYPGERPWTLVLLVGGLSLGCLNAWRWVLKEHRAITAEQEDASND